MNTKTCWFDVEHVADGTYRILEGVGYLPCYVYLIVDGGEAVLLDTGLGIGDLGAVVEDIAGTNPRVLLTHSHWDHIGAGNAFDDVAINPRERTDGGTVRMDYFSDQSKDRPREFVEHWRELGKEFPDGFDPDNYAIDPVTDVGAVHPGGRLTVGDRTLEVLPTPGHSPGQVAILDRTTGICHAADVLEPGSELYAHLVESDLPDYRETFDRLLKYRDAGAFDVLTIGHGEPIADDDLSVLGDALDALDSIIRGTATYDVIETNWGRTRQYTLNGVEVLTAADE